MIRNLANDGIAILITDHAAREILQLAHRTFVVSEGRILVSGSSKVITQNEIVRAKYLGDISVIENQTPQDTAGQPVYEKVRAPHVNNDARIKFKSRIEGGSKSSGMKSTDLD